MPTKSIGTPGVKETKFGESYLGTSIKRMIEEITGSGGFSGNL